MPLRNTPIRKKLIIIFMMVGCLVSVLTSVSLFSYEYVTFRRGAVQQLSTVGEIVSANSTAALAFDNRDDAQEILAALRAEPHIEAAGLYKNDGLLFASYPAGLPGSAFPATLQPDGSRFNQSHIDVFQPVSEGDRRLGTLYLRYDLAALYDRMWLYAGIIAVVMAASVILAYALSARLQSQISEPILALAETAGIVTARGDYSVRAPKLGNDETGLLTDSFNQMLAEIQKLNQELEQRVRDRTAQLEEANRELEAFSYSVSHDLRAPLRHVDGFAGLLQKHAGASLDEKGRRFLTTISSAARQMGRLIDDLLSFSRINRSAISLTDIDHDALVAAVIKEGRFEENGRAIEWSVSPLPRVMADPALLTQVWSNLIGNAVKYSGKKERPRIAIGSSRDAATGEHVFSVTDNGAGFDMQYAAKLFGVFQRLHGPAEFEGTGIGLANVHRIVSRHGGRTWATGRVDEGATFYFSLPASLKSQAPLRFPAPSVPLPTH